MIFHLRSSWRRLCLCGGTAASRCLFPPDMGAPNGMDDGRKAPEHPLQPSRAPAHHIHRHPRARHRSHHHHHARLSSPAAQPVRLLRRLISRASHGLTELVESVPNAAWGPLDEETTGLGTNIHASLPLIAVVNLHHPPPASTPFSTPPARGFGSWHALRASAGERCLFPARRPPRCPLHL